MSLHSCQHGRFAPSDPDLRWRMEEGIKGREVSEARASRCTKTYEKGESTKNKATLKSLKRQNIRRRPPVDSNPLPPPPAMCDADAYESLGDDVPLRVTVAAGAAAGVAEHCVMYPVDSVKVSRGGLGSEFVVFRVNKCDVSYIWQIRLRQQRTSTYRGSNLDDTLLFPGNESSKP